MSRYKAVIISFATIFILACEGNEDIPSTMEEFIIDGNEELSYQLGNRPAEGGYSITKQAKFYKISKITADETSGGLKYLYAPKNNFKGNETVEITLRTSPGDNNFKSQLIVLRITVE